MADEADLADCESAVQFSKRLERMRKQHMDRPSTRHCIDCGEPIPAARLAIMAMNNLTCERCIACQTKAESGI